MIVTPYGRIHEVSGRVRHCISELESLAISPKRLDDLNDAYEMQELVDNIKFNYIKNTNQNRIRNRQWLQGLLCAIKTFSKIGIIDVHSRSVW